MVYEPIHTQDACIIKAEFDILGEADRETFSRESRPDSGPSNVHLGSKERRTPLS